MSSIVQDSICLVLFVLNVWLTAKGPQWPGGKMSDILVQALHLSVTSSNCMWGRYQENQAKPINIQDYLSVGYI